MPKDWEAQAAMKLGGRLEATGMPITVGRDVAVVSNENGENLNVKGEIQKVSIRATNLFSTHVGSTHPQVAAGCATGRC